MSMRCARLALLASVWLPAVCAQQTYNTYIGCFNNLPSDASPIVSGDLPTDNPSCQTACASLPTDYSLWQPSSSTCYCGNVAPDNTLILNTGSSQGCYYESQYMTSMLGTTETFVGQYPDATLTDPSATYVNVATFADCFRHGINSNAATIYRSSYWFQCYCTAVTSVVGNSPIPAYYTYWHVAGSYAAGPQGSEFVKRQGRERLRRSAQLHLTAACPGDLTACQVPGSEGSFECIDTSSELESCGGCVAGFFNKNATGPLGENCSAMGAAFGASTCRDGRCVASGCRKGLKLVDGRCVSSP